MSQLNTLDLRDRLISRVNAFALDDHFVSDSVLRGVLETVWSGPPERGGLGSDLWVEGAFPSEQADETLGQVADGGLLAKTLARQLDRVSEFPLNRAPYTHQLRSLEAALESRDVPDGQPALVVTAGTGAGKTESFLLPMLERLWTQAPTYCQGVSAIILYPMNALVNDQVGRLDKWLEGQDRVSFFHFTSETPENKRRADERGTPEATRARFRTRQQARGFEDREGKKIEDGSGPQPQILVTNYSMLEYMLCRPQDAVFFGRNLRVLVLDEAHIYTGNLAAEITLLLRRVQMRCGRTPEEVLHIATSATIGGGAAALRPFAAHLFSKDESLVRLIEGRRVRSALEVADIGVPLPLSLAEQLAANPPPESGTVRVTPNGDSEFIATDDEEWLRWRDVLSLLAPEPRVSKAMNRADRLAAPMLADVLRFSPAVARLQTLLWADETMPRLLLPELAAQMFGQNSAASQQATRILLQMSACARSEPGEWPLVPNRLHYLMRGPEGMMLSFRRDVNAAAYHPLNGIGQVFSAGADPAACGAFEDHPLTLIRCQISGWWGVAARQVNGMMLPVPSSIVLHGRNEDGEELFDPENPNQQQALRVKLFSLTEIEGVQPRHFNPQTGRYSGNGAGVPLWELPNCPVRGLPLCPVSGVPLDKNSIGWFAARARLQLSLIAETALAAMPEFPHANKAWKPARGRRLLVFSDSRAEAARLGPRLTRQHELQLFRAAVIHVLGNLTQAASDGDVSYYQQKIASIEADLAMAKSAVIRQDLLADRAKAQEKLREAESGGSVRQWADRLGESPLIAEIMDLDSAEGHESKDDNRQQRWQRNAEQVQASLVSLLGRELARRPTWPQPGLETLGLVEVVYPGIEALTPPPQICGMVSMGVAEALRQTWAGYLASVLDALRNQGCVTLGRDRDDDDYKYGSALLGKYFSARDSFKREMLSFIGVHFEGQQTSRRNAFTRDYLVACGMSREVAVQRAGEVMEHVFDQLLDHARNGSFNWLEVKPSSETNGGDHVVPSMRMRFPLLGLRVPSRLYRCQMTGQVWPRSIAGLYPGAARTSLSGISADDLDQDARLGRRRRELREWEGFRLGLWAEEHSAQLSPQENARLQDLFRDGMRNILSSTTTLELGIDIGGLSAVLLGNLPPGKANYLQRAGRAGRRADGSSAVLGFARPSPYEREVFLDFRRYLNRDLRRPTVFLDRAAIVRRHAHSWLLGEFFRSQYLHGEHTGAMDAYGKMGRFTGEPLPDKWNSDDKPVLPPRDATNLADAFLSYLDQIATSAPVQMQQALAHLWRGCPELEALIQDTMTSWPVVIQEFRSEFAAAYEKWREDVRSLLAAWDEVPAIPPVYSSAAANRAQANAIYYQLRTLHQMTVIESLADARVLPRYGFPIGQCKLHVQVSERDPHTGRYQLREEDQFRLQRDSMMAMREYVPGSQLLAGGKIVTSRGLLKHWTGAMLANESWGLRGRFIRTQNGYFHYSCSNEAPRQPTNVNPQSPPSSGEMIFPKTGFCTSTSEQPRHGSDFEKVGSVEVYTIAFEDAARCDTPQPGFGGIPGCTVTYCHGGELLLLNGGEFGKGFAICQKCGYADSELHSTGQGRVNLPSHFERHHALQSTARWEERRCWEDDEAPVWRRQHLAARQTTHLLKLDFSRCGQPLSEELIRTLGQALRLAAAIVLEQDAREIRAIEPSLDPQAGGYASVVLYDTLAGGAGHLAQLSHPSYPERAREWIDQTIALLTVEPTFPDSVRQREAMRRVLTSDATDDMVPVEALAFLLQARNAAGDVEPVAVVDDPIPEDAWTLDRLLTEDPPHQFELTYRLNDIAGVTDMAQCEVCTAKPSPGARVILRNEGLNGGIAAGRWLASVLNDGTWRVRLGKTEGDSPVLHLRQAEYDSLIPLAIIHPNA
ncbi:DEAD/DEAH box helicase [Prosthecobacter dejongeii]|uniref:Replicative superfamily II helicase n=1 Tax=Prosthecobacter dejongeii TaxID=48465 RepID=A0A7W8DNV2_9BACT|nr:DEAD/DEAH box helicase [Prosthecobacter dejongeii]MBB5036753.1 replicative superfamily II helicase [Prosthecobacter dejongeii]